MKLESLLLHSFLAVADDVALVVAIIARIQFKSQAYGKMYFVYAEMRLLSLCRHKNVLFI